MLPTQNNSVQIAESEIKKIFISLNLLTFESEKEIILEKFQVIQPAFNINTKYRDPKLLIRIIIYLYFLLFDHKIDKSDLKPKKALVKERFNTLCVVRMYW